MRFEQYINEAKTVSNSKSFNELGNKIGITSAAISRIRSGGPASERTILKIAELAKRDPIKVMSSYKIDRAKSTVEAEFWRSLLRQAAGVILVVTAMGFPLVEESKASNQNENTFTSYTLCAIAVLRIKGVLSSFGQSLLTLIMSRKSRVFA